MERPGYPGASIPLLILWNTVFVVFTSLQLKWNKTPLLIGGHPLLSVSDAIEFAVPWCVLPLYWIIWSSSFRTAARPKFRGHLLPMIIATALFTHGHGIHLSSNSLSNLFHKLKLDSAPGSETYMAALDLYDEFLSHILWVSGLCTFAFCIMRTQAVLPSTNAHFSGRQTPSLAHWRRLTVVEVLVCCLLATVYGVLFACHNIEGATAFIGAPFSVFLLLYIFKNGHLLRISRITVFFLASHLITLLIFVSWYYLNDYTFPEFSALREKNFINQFYANSASNKVEL